MRVSLLTPRLKQYDVAGLCNLIEIYIDEPDSSAEKTRYSCAASRAIIVAYQVLSHLVDQLHWQTDKITVMGTSVMTGLLSD